jgi:hypothetical protein
MYIFEEGGYLRAKILLPLEADQPHLLLEEGLQDGGDHFQAEVGQGPDGPNEQLQLYIVVVQAHETICCQSLTETAFPMEIAAHHGDTGKCCLKGCSRTFS